MIGQKAIGSRYVDDRRISTVLGPNCGGVYRAPSWSSLTETKGRHVQQSLNNCSRDGRSATAFLVEDSSEYLLHDVHELNASRRRSMRGFRRGSGVSAATQRIDQSDQHSYLTYKRQA